MALSVGSAATAGGPLVGYVGCSQTRDIAKGIDNNGYNDTNQYWESDIIRRGYDGGTVLKWGRVSDRSKYWRTFNAAVAVNPGTTDVWVQICVKDFVEEGPRLTRFDAAEITVTEIRRILPGVTVHVSAMNEYDDPDLCTLSGPTGPAIAQGVVDHLVESGLALEGPIVGPLTAATTSDGCHANAEGQAFQAGQLDAYFFGLQK
jgi:hypothetical protein